MEEPLNEIEVEMLSLTSLPIKKVGPYIAGLLALIILLSIYKSKWQAEAASIKSAAMLVNAQDSIKILHDSLLLTNVPIIKVRKEIDTLWRIRTVILSKVDSAWMRSDSLIALVPKSDSACHTAYDTLKSGCELLKGIVARDSVVIKSADSTLLVTQGRISSYINTTSALKDELAIVKKPYICTIIFGIPCPSRLVSAVLGILTVEGLRIVGGKP